MQALLATNAVERTATRTRSGALLMGKLFDDAGNAMSPSYSTKKAVRYRFYVSSALLRGRKAKAGTVGRVAAIPIEEAVTAAARKRYDACLPDREGFRDYIERVLSRVVLHKDRLRLTLLDQTGAAQTEDLPWSARSAPRLEAPDRPVGLAQPLLKAVVRARAWLKQLEDGTYPSIEGLSQAANLNPKAIRQSITLAFLPPSTLNALLCGAETDLPPVRELQAAMPLNWHDLTTN